MVLYYRLDGSQKVARSPLRYFNQATRMDKLTVIKKYCEMPVAFAGRDI